MFIPRINLLTRLELFLRRNDLAPAAVAEAAVYSRQHLLRVRLGKVVPTQRCIVKITEACEKLTGEDVAPRTLFERGDQLLAGRLQRLSQLFANDLQTLDRLLQDVSGNDWPARVTTDAVNSETAVRHLLFAGEPRIDHNPRIAAAIYEAAAMMSASLPDTAPELAASLEGHALKGRANALRHLGEFNAALIDLERAAKRFVKARYCLSEAGQAEYTRGTVLFQMERWAEALIAANHARGRFIKTGDARRAAHAGVLEAGILFEQGDVDAARDTWLRLLGILEELEDTEALARVWQNLGAAEVRRGRSKEARRWLRRAAAAFRKSGHATELARTRWNMATYAARFRGPERGMRALEAVQREFVRLELFADAACVGLEILELMVESSAPPAALARYAKEVANALSLFGLAVSEASAVDQLRRITRADDPRAVVRDARAALRMLDKASGGCREGREAPARTTEN